MNTRPLRQVLDWLRSTDLSEISYRKGSDKVHFKFEDAPSRPEGFPPCRLTPVLSPEVGLFRRGAVGRAAAVAEGGDVRSGADLGLVDTGLSKKKITAPVAGKVVTVLAEDGNPVEYGQPLYFIEPR